MTTGFYEIILCAMAMSAGLLFGYVIGKAVKSKLK